MDEDRRRILEMLASGKINAAEAEQLLDAMGDTAEAGEQAAGDRPPVKALHHLCVVIEKPACTAEGHDRKVNVRVPLSIVRAGVRLAAVMPGGAGERVTSSLRDQGIDLDAMKADPAKIEELLAEMGELTVDLDDGKGRIRVYCE